MHAYDRRGRSLARARARARERENCPSPRRGYKYIHAHTEMESAANALTYDGLLLREVGRRDTWLYVYVHILARVLRVARVRPSGSSSSISSELFRVSLCALLVAHIVSALRMLCIYVLCE